MKIYERIQRKGQFVIHEFKKRKELKPWILPLFELMNECYINSNIYGYAPLDHKEMNDLANRYLPVVDPRFVKIVTKDDEVVSFIIAMPDMTAGIRESPRPAFSLGVHQDPPGGQENQAARSSSGRRSRRNTGAWAWTC